jgi:hypothetical protein
VKCIQTSVQTDVAVFRAIRFGGWTVVDSASGRGAGRGCSPMRDIGGRGRKEKKKLKQPSCGDVLVPT